MTFDTTSTSTSDYKAVVCECGNSDVTANIVVVAVKKIEMQENGSWEDKTGKVAYAAINSPTGFRAQPAPTGATWPSGTPVWGGSSGASGTSESTSVIFSTVSSNLTDYKTVTCSCGNTANVNVIAVGVDRFQWKQSSGDPWTTITASTVYVPVGESRDFKALPAPTGATWPSGKPVWSGSSGVSGTGETASATFNTTSTSATDFKTVAANCGNTVTLNVIVAGLRFITPAGDPVNSPKQSGDGQNEFTFSNDTTGVLTINFKALALPSGAADAITSDVIFSVDSIGNSTKAWAQNNSNGKSVANGDYLEATVTFTGLPMNNSDFGSKTTTLSFNGMNLNHSCEVFYPRNTTNHPGGDQTPSGRGSSRSPNWFYYWNQTIGDPDGLYDSTIGNYYGWTPAMLLWSSPLNYSKSAIWIGSSAAGSDARRDGSGQTVTGIDLFANVVSHENYHVTQISLADSLLGSLNGTGIWSSGWSWNYSPNNHWTYVDGDLDQDDNDVPNAWEPATIEGQAEQHENIPEGTNINADWGNPGKNHNTTSYND